MLDLPQLHKHLQALEDGDDSVRQQALQALRQHDEQEWATAANDVSYAVVKALKRQLLHGMTKPGALKEITTVLGNIGPRSKSALPELLGLLRNDVPDVVREAAVNAVGKIGKDAGAAVDHLVQLLATSRPALSAQAIRALANIGCADDRVRAVLVELWLSPQLPQSGKAQAAVALCKLNLAPQSLLGTLTKSLVEGSEGSVRRAAAEALGWADKNETDVVPALLTASLSDANDDVRQTAQASLDQMHLSHEKAIPLCSRQLGDAVYAEAALRKSGGLAVDALMEALRRDEPAVRVKAARTLGCLGAAAAMATPALIAALRDRDLDVRLASAKGLWNITQAAAVVVPALVDLLQGKVDVGANETRRRFLQTVMEALSRIGPPAKAAVVALTAMTKDNNRHIRESAIVTLQKIVPADANKPGLRQ